MEGKKKMISSVLVVVLVLHVIVGQSEAKSFLTCFKDCEPQCLAGGRALGMALCSGACIAQCLHQHAKVTDDNQYNCALPRAQSSCATLSTPQDMKAEQVSNCVDGCVNECV